MILVTSNQRFSKKEKEKNLEFLMNMIKRNDIEIRQWFVASKGKASKAFRYIKIPRPTDIDRLGVCFHEVYHIICPRYEHRCVEEFYADKFALDMLDTLQYDTVAWKQRMTWHILKIISKDIISGTLTTEEELPMEIKKWFCDVNFSEWFEAKKIYVSAIDKFCNGVYYKVDEKIYV